MPCDKNGCLLLLATKLVLTSSGFPLEPSKIPSLPGPEGPNAGAGSRQEGEPGSRDFMLKRGPGFLPPASPGQGRPPRGDVIDRITPDDLDKLYSEAWTKSGRTFSRRPVSEDFLVPEWASEDYSAPVVASEAFSARDLGLRVPFKVRRHFQARVTEAMMTMSTK